MASKEKWVELFEKVVGRIPSPQEFLEGKKVNFDLKEIKRIAERSYDDKVILEKIAKKKTTDFSASETINTDEQSLTTSASQSPEQAWVKVFERAAGRKPRKDEFMVGKKAQFALTSISKILSNPSTTQSSRPARKPLSKQKYLMLFVAILVVALAVDYVYGNQYFSREAVAKRYLKLANNQFDKALTYEVWSDTQKPIKKSELSYRDAKENNHITMDDLTSGDRQMKNVGRKWLIFPDWRVAIKPATAKIFVNTKNLDLYINDKKVARTDSASYTKNLSRLYPGSYRFLVKGNISGQKVQVSSEEKVSGSLNVNLDVKYLSFKVKSNLTDGDLYVGSRKIGKLRNGEYTISKLAVTDAAKVYVQKTFSGQSVLKSKVESIEDIHDGDTIALDAKGILDRNTADSLVTQAYQKLSSYASSQTRPDDLEDIFKGGTDNKFYQGVKDSIDTNTTRAKNRSADSITFSDVDITKITQTSPTTYAVEFTVIYDFYYSYNSEHKSSGDIIQKLSWSALIEYVGDDEKDNSDDYFYDSYHNYRIISDNGKSSVLNTKDTVK